LVDEMATNEARPAGDKHGSETLTLCASGHPHAFPLAAERSGLRQLPLRRVDQANKMTCPHGLVHLF
jgi:hypothetical protein